MPFLSEFRLEMLTLQGHEFTGTVEEVGSGVKNFKKGDQIVSPFTISWLAPRILKECGES